jgi:EAL domain-containing protein (putative c-di-GMP-specific phosphodiesterase class I)
MEIQNKLENRQVPTGNWFLSGQINESEGIRRIMIPALPCEVGRRSDALVSIPANSVSKSHAEFFEVDERLCLRDQGSSNGTFVNGQRLVSGYSVLEEGDLIQFATVVFRLSRGRHNTESRTLQEDSCDRALAMMQFDRLMNDGGLVPFFQPVVDVKSSVTIGYEVLGRSRLFGLKTPAEMFSAASKLNLEAELSRVMRVQGVQLCETLPRNMDIYLNTHPSELSRSGLVDSLQALRELAPDQVLTLEIHEAAITNPALIVELRQQLAALDMKLAFDDFGVGRARLVELSEVRPDVVKFDMKLTRDIHRATDKRREVVSLIAKMVNDLGIVSLAEGVECEESHEVLKEMNFTLAQGFLYGKPAPISFWTDPQAGSDTNPPGGHLQHGEGDLPTH